MKKNNDQGRQPSRDEKVLMKIMVGATVISFIALGVAFVSLKDFLDKGTFNVGFKEVIAGLVGGVIGWLLWKIPAQMAAKRRDHDSN